MTPDRGQSRSRSTLASPVERENAFSYKSGRCVVFGGGATSEVWMQIAAEVVGRSGHGRARYPISWVAALRMAEGIAGSPADHRLAERSESVES